jgi:hypothetical protein
LAVLRIVELAHQDRPEPAPIGLAIGDLGGVVDELLAKLARIGRPGRERTKFLLAV